MSKLKLNNVEVITDENAKGIPELTDNVVFPSGHVVNSTIVTNSSSVVLPTSSNYFFWLFNFNKKLSSTESYLIIHGQLPGQVAAGNYCGEYCEISGSNESDRGTDGSAYKGLGYMGADAANEAFWMIILKKFTGLNAGSHQVQIGYQCRNGASDRWCGVWNPSNYQDARNHQARTNLIINEIKI